MAPVIGVVVFPGTNCEHDVIEVVQDLGASARLVWHTEDRLDGIDAVVIPGGFAHGDYLRPGAIARFSPVMNAIVGFAGSGGPVVGICNGFQVLTEVGLLPGALQKNRGLTFLCAPVALEVVTTSSVLTRAATVGQVLTIPVNHFEGNYTCDERTLAQLRAEDRILLRYVDDVNGSVDRIAAVGNAEGNVAGLMPHPERASHPLLGSTDGVFLLRGLLDAVGVSSTS